MAHTPISPDAHLRERDVLALIPVSRSQFWRMVRDGRFPKPVRLGARITAWRFGDVQTWLADRAAASANPPEAA